MDLNHIPQSLRDQISPELLEQLAQELNKPVYGPKSVERHMPTLCRKAAAEGAVLLKNEGVLPLAPGQPVAVFGRVQLDWFYVGYGSGGDVNPPYRVNLMEGLRSAGVTVDAELAQTYAAWCAENEPFPGVWGRWPRCFEEMPISDGQVRAAAARCSTAIVVLGRAAGEDRENTLDPGSYLLTEAERRLLSQVTSSFEKTAVLIDAGSVFDLSWLADYRVGAALFLWQGGMESGNAAADLLTGRVTPCGKLADTIAYRYEDYPCAKDFLGRDFNFYTEDVYVGYRYFETFAPDKVQFPFGFGLSYTTFAFEDGSVERLGDRVRVKLRVRNTGSRPGREVAQIYGAAPQGSLGKPARVLAAFRKTKLLQPGEAQSLLIEFPVERLASFDDSGASGCRNAWVLEPGSYTIFAGPDVRAASPVGAFSVAQLRVLSRLEEAAAPAVPFRRLVNRGGRPSYEPVPLAERSLKDRIVQSLPAELPFTGDRGIKLRDVAEGLASMEDFVAQLTPEELEALTHGDFIMDSPLGTRGNAAVMGGITESLRAKGVPPVTTTDGPSGIRLQYYCSLLPCGTALACTWDPDLVESLYQSHGREMVRKGSDVLLGPGMNIHRSPLCGRNFEYFSEDPLLTGKTGAAMVRGIQKNGVSACPKHFACNNQETNRNYCDSRLSQRALREIYLKGFEICVKEGKPQNIMTSYNKINGVWGHYHYDLCTTVLRGEWGFGGSVMTDWWMRLSPDPDFPQVWDSAYRIRAGVNVLMPGGLDQQGTPDPSALESLHRGGLTLAELQRSACQVLGFVAHSRAMRRLDAEGLPKLPER